MTFKVGGSKLIERVLDLGRNRVETASVSCFELNSVCQRGGSGPASASFL
jgi:hypothetical protein